MSSAVSEFRGLGGLVVEHAVRVLERLHRLELVLADRKRCDGWQLAALLSETLESEGIARGQRYVEVILVLHENLVQGLGHMEDRDREILIVALESLESFELSGDRWSRKELTAHMRGALQRTGKLKSPVSEGIVGRLGALLDEMITAKEAES